MSEEIAIIQEIFRLKKQKSYWINIQSYENAATARDSERECERKLIKILKNKPFIIGDETNNMFWFIADDKIYDNEVMSDKLKEYFKKKFGILYPNNLTNENDQIKYENFIKQLVRNEILNSLGI